MRISAGKPRKSLIISNVFFELLEDKGVKADVFKKTGYQTKGFFATIRRLTEMCG